MGLLTGMEKEKRHFIQGQMCRLYNISLQLDDQTRAGEYGEMFQSEIKLEQFLDLYTGEWK